MLRRLEALDAPTGLIEKAQLLDADYIPIRRILTFLPYFDLMRGSDLLVYTLAELEGRLAAGDHFIQRIWSESIPIRIL